MIRDILLSAILITGAASLCPAAVLTVTSLADSGPGTLRQRIAEAAPGDTVNFDPQLFATPATITLSSEVLIDKPLRLCGPGVTLLKVTTTGSGRQFRIEFEGSVADALLFSGLRVSGARSESSPGTAVSINTGEAQVDVVNCRFDDNRNFTGSSLGGASVYYGGYGEGVMRVRRCGFDWNNAAYAMFGSGTVKISDCVFFETILALRHGRPHTIQNCFFPLGGMYIQTSSSFLDVPPIEMSHCTILSQAFPNWEQTAITGPVRSLPLPQHIKITNSAILGYTTSIDTNIRLTTDSSNNVFGPTPASVWANGINNTVTDAVNWLTVDSYGRPYPGSPLLDAGLAANSPALDLTAHGRSGAPDIGVFEYNGPSFASAWRQMTFGSSTANTGYEQDFDADGLTNLTECAAGTDATTAGGSGGPAYDGVTVTAGMPVLRERSGTRWVEYSRRSDIFGPGVPLLGPSAVRLTHTPEFSATLQTWTPGTVTPVVLMDDGITQLVTVPFPAGSTPPAFFRVTTTPN